MANLRVYDSEGIDNFNLTALAVSADTNGDTFVGTGFVDVTIFNDNVSPGFITATIPAQKVKTADGKYETKDLVAVVQAGEAQLINGISMYSYISGYNKVKIVYDDATNVSVVCVHSEDKK